MFPSTHDRSPILPVSGFSQWSGGVGAGGTINASVVLDQPGNIAYTNLDQISGVVVCRTGKSTDITSIVVKLEGESRTRLMSPAGPNGERPKPQVEYHKILYRVQTVFPPADVAESRSHASGRASYTLPGGQHEYPFSFKLPFNNSCDVQPSAMPVMIGMEIAKPATRHVKRTLPPTLSGFPGEAEIRYFVKVTVNRHSLFKENPRAYSPFNFFPIEPPRPPNSGSEIFARQRHQFDSFPDFGSGGTAKEKMMGMFGKKSSVPDSPTSTGGAPALSVDARLPEPAILTCNQDIPLRLIVKKLNDYSDPIYLQSLQISLIGHTKIRAHDVFRVESNSWIILSKSNMGVPLGNLSDEADTETVVDDSLWRNQSLPNTVAPAFTTCNIERSYQLDIRIGLSYGGNQSKPQQVVLPLRLDAMVYSGIAPPPEVIARMTETNSGIRRKSTNAMEAKLRAERRDSEFGANQVPPTPMEPLGMSNAAWPAQPGSPSVPQYDEAPPSYEDAIAQSAPPVTAPRPTYAPPAAVQDPLLGGDEKKGWMG